MGCGPSIRKLLLLSFRVIFDLVPLLCQVLSVPVARTTSSSFPRRAPQARCLAVGSTYFCPPSGLEMAVESHCDCFESSAATCQPHHLCAPQSLTIKRGKQ